MIQLASGVANRPWVTGALVAVVLHIGVVGAFFVHLGSHMTPVESTAIAVDMAPVAVAPPSPRHDTPTPDQIETPQPKPDKVPTVKPLPFDPPPEARADETPDAVVPKQAKEDPAPAVTQRPPAPETTKQAAPDAVPDKKLTAPVDGAANSGATNPADIWGSRVMARIQQAKRYPVAARLQHQEAKMIVKIVIDRSGKLVSAALVGTSGYSLLDTEAIAAVHRAAPFPKPPPEVTGDPVLRFFFIEFVVTKS